jgi:hypothetical protein
MIVNPKSHIPALIQGLQRRLKTLDKTMTQKEIATTLYPTGYKNPTENYRKRFMRRSKTQFRVGEIVDLIKIFEPVITAREAVFLVGWSQVEADEGELEPIEQIRGQFDEKSFAEALKDYETRTSFADVLAPSGAKENYTKKKLIPFYQLPTSIEEIDIGQLVGTDAQVGKIVGMITEKNGSRFISIEGQGGLGKTSIAYSVVEQIRRESNFEAVIWVSVGRHLSLVKFDIKDHGYESVLSQIGRRFKLPDEPSVLSLLENEPHLVIIDNIETQQDAESGLLSGLAPLNQGRSRFLITSRFALQSSFSFIHAIPLKELPIADIKLLLERLFEGIMPISEETARQVKATIGGIPLAIHILARLARTTSLKSVLNTIEKLQINIKDQHEKLSIAFNYMYGAIWQKHLELPTKKLLVRLASESPPNGIPRNLLVNTSGIPIRELNQALENAMDYYLLTKAETEDGDLLLMHALTQSYIQLACQDNGKSNVI